MATDITGLFTIVEIKPLDITKEPLTEDDLIRDKNALIAKESILVRRHKIQSNAFLSGVVAVFALSVYMLIENYYQSFGVLLLAFSALAGLAWYMHGPSEIESMLFIYEPISNKAYYNLAEIAEKNNTIKAYVNKITVQNREITKLEAVSIDNYWRNEEIKCDRKNARYAVEALAD